MMRAISGAISRKRCVSPLAQYQSFTDDAQYIGYLRHPTRQSSSLRAGRAVVVVVVCVCVGVGGAGVGGWGEKGRGRERSICVQPYVRLNHLRHQAIVDNIACGLISAAAVCLFQHGVHELISAP